MTPVVRFTPSRLLSVLCLFVLSTSLSHVSVASGGGGGFYDDEPTPVDHTYEAGKAIFKGRNQAYKPHTFCVVDQKTGEVTKIKRKTIKPYKRQPAGNLMNNLYSCEDTTTRARAILGEDLPFLVYYLNKRYSLRLKR